MDKPAITAENAGELHAAGMVLLDKAADIISRRGENVATMSEIGDLLREMTASGVFEPLLTLRKADDKSTAVDVIAEHVDGSKLSLYVTQNWQSPPVTEVHWHNYWQVLLCMEGSWPDTVWKPVNRLADGRAQDIAVDHHETIAEGMIQPLGPTEPHGWTADDQKPVDLAILLMWSGNSRGLPRTDLDLATGELSEEFGMLNFRPGEEPVASTYSWIRF